MPEFILDGTPECWPRGLVALRGKRIPDLHTLLVIRTPSRLVKKLGFPIPGHVIRYVIVFRNFYPKKSNTFLRMLASMLNANLWFGARTEILSEVNGLSALIRAVFTQVAS